MFIMAKVMVIKRRVVGGGQNRRQHSRRITNTREAISTFITSVRDNRDDRASNQVVTLDNIAVSIDDEFYTNCNLFWFRSSPRVVYAVATQENVVGVLSA